MKDLSVMIEVGGQDVFVGKITGENSENASFSYADSYLSDSESRPISLSMPLEQKSFDAVRTRNYFEGLLPEGFSRKCVAEWIRADENDYLAILEGLGSECLGAIKIIDETAKTGSSLPGYRKLNAVEVLNLAREGATKSAELVTKAHLSLAGASGKAGLYYHEKEREWYLPFGTAPSTHIVKQSHVRLKQIVTNEQLCLLTARNLGIEIPDSFIINADDRDEESILFATRRYDRKFSEDEKLVDGLPVPRRLHQEDFAQAMGVAASFKYERNREHYLRKMFSVLRNYSSDPIEDQLKLWDICIFNFLIGNTDNHIKNLSLLYGEDLKTIRLAPVYDIVSTMVYENSSENMSLSIGGVLNIHDVKRDSFKREARSVDIGEKIAMQRLDKMADSFEAALYKAGTILEEQGYPQVNIMAQKILSAFKQKIA